MELQNKQRRSISKSYFGKLRVLIFAGVLGLVFIFGVYYSNGIRSSEFYQGTKKIVKALRHGNSQAIVEYIKGGTFKQDDFKIDISFKNLLKLRYNRKLAIQQGYLSENLQEEVAAKITFDNEIYRVKICLTGYELDHFIDEDKFSLMIKVKDEKTINGMKKFALLIPSSRGYLTDWIATKLLLSRNVIGLRTDFIDAQINGKSMGVYYLEERYDKRLVENNRRPEGIIFKINNSTIDIYGEDRINQSKVQLERLILLRQLWSKFISGQMKAEDLFDVKKFASFYAVSDIMNTKHALLNTNVRYYFNPITCHIEPICREWQILTAYAPNEVVLSIEQPSNNSFIPTNFHKRLFADDVSNKIFNTLNFKKQYMNELSVLLGENYIENVLRKNQSDLSKLTKKIYRFDPNYKFPRELLLQNRFLIQTKMLSKQYTLSASVLEIDKNELKILVKNHINLPIKIRNLRYNKRTFRPLINNICKAAYNSKARCQEVKFDITDLDFNAFSIDSLIIAYNVLGFDKSYNESIVYADTSYKSDFDNLVLRKKNIEDFNFIEVQDNKREIYFTHSNCTINKDLIIPKGYTVYIGEGCQVDLTNSAKIISYSPIHILGTNRDKVTVTSSDSTGQGIVISNCERTSKLNYVIFRGLSNISDSGWHLSGAITFYESPVSINHCRFVGNINGDDYLNIVRTDFSIENSTFEKTNADALDADFCSGSVKNVKFIQVGNDAIDVSGSNIKLSDIYILNPEDKGISGGEDSHLVCKNVTIKGGEIAVASKDNSKIEINNLIIDSTQLGYCAFQKKTEFGPGIIIVKNAKTDKVTNNHLIETGSVLYVNGVQVTEKMNKVKELLYGVTYGKSSK